MKAKIYSLALIVAFGFVSALANTVSTPIRTFGFGLVLLLDC